MKNKKKRGKREFYFPSTATLHTPSTPPLGLGGPCLGNRPLLYLKTTDVFGRDLISGLQAASPEDKGKAGAARPPARPPRRCPELWTPRNPGQDAPPSWNCPWPVGAGRQAPKIGWVAAAYGFRLHSVLGALWTREADSASSLLVGKLSENYPHRRARINMRGL